MGFSAICGYCGNRFDEVLKQAEAAKERVCVFSHYPLAQGAARENHVVANTATVCEIMRRHAGVVRCVFAGHDHRGGSVRDVDGALLHVTIQATLEAGGANDGNAYAAVTAFDDGSLVIRGSGDVPSYSIESGM